MTKQTNLNKIMTRGKALMLAYDHGLEHGPSDFTDKNANPEYILEIARKAKLNAIVLHKGLAEEYYNKKKDVPLVLKLNGKTKLEKGEPLSTRICTVQEAIALGAVAVGYTIYLGSKFEPIMLEDFSIVEREALASNLPVIVWMYPRGKAIKNPNSREILAYSARVGLEIGADIIKLQYNGNASDLKYAVKMAGKAKILVAGGEKSKNIIEVAKEVMNAGASGMIVGRNIWQAREPVKIANQLKKVIFGKIT